MESSEEEDLAGASFEDLLGRLEQVVERLEGGDLPLEQALTAFEQGVRLSRLGAERLDDAERRVEELLSADPVRLRPLDLSGEEP